MNIQRRIRLKDTDATGGLYFPQQFQMAIEVFEEFLVEKGLFISDLIQGPFLLPVVHAEGDYFAPLKVGDLVEIQITGCHVKEKSIMCESSLFKIGDCFGKKSPLLVGKVKIIHAVVDRKMGKSIPIPEELKKIFQ